MLFDADCLRWETEKHFRSSVFAVFGKPGNRDVQLQLFHYLSDYLHLPLSTVSDNQVGQGRFFL